MNSARTFEVPSNRISNLFAAIERLAKRAAKKGISVPSLTTRGTKMVEILRVVGEHVEPTGQFREVTIVELVSETPAALVGWRFVATLEHTPDGNVIRAIDGVKIPAAFRTVAPVCDHCKLNRRRSDTYLLARGEEFVQIGRSCIQDFLGDEAAKIAAEFEYQLACAETCEASESEGAGGGGPSYYGMLGYLADVAEVIKVEGWISRGAAQKCDARATADIALSHHTHCIKPIARLYAEPSAESFALAETALAWAQDLTPGFEDDYLYNLSLIAKREFLALRDLGLAASIVSAYQRHLGDLRRKELERLNRAASVHMGVIGEQLRVRVVVDKIIASEGAYGTTHIHLMTSAEGNAITWFSSSECLPQGESILIQGCVKKHDEYKGVNKTVLTRVCEIELRTFLVVVAGVVHEIEALDEKEAKTAVKARLGLARLPKGTAVSVSA